MKKLLSLIAPFRLQFFGAVLALAVAGLFTGALIGSIKPLMDDIWGTKDAMSEPSQVDKIFGYQNRLLDHLQDGLRNLGLTLDDMGLGQDGIDLENPLPWAILVIFLYLGHALFDFLGTYTMGKVGLRIVVDLRRRLIEKVTTLSIQFLKEMNTGEILSRIHNDVMRIQLATSVKMGEMVKQSTVAVVSAILVFLINWKLSLTLFVLVPLVGLPIAVFTRKIKKNALRSQTFLGLLSGRLKEVLVGMRIVKAFGKEAFETKRLCRDNDLFYKYARREILIIAMTAPIIGILGMLIIVTFVSFGTYAIQTTNMTTGDFLTYVLFIYKLYEPIKRLARSNSEIQQAVGVLPRIEEILDRDNEIEDPLHPKKPRNFPDIDTLTFESVHFSYEDKPEEHVLRDVSFTMTRGQKIALVGPSGSGKTTLVNLLPRFYDISSGRILIDGVDVRDFRKDELRSLIGMVTQETILFNETVHDNIAYGIDNASRRDVIEAAKKAYAHEFIEAMNHGYDTVIGESGMRLSGGQRQRISIARAILRNAPILILDEATSALDSESEQIVQEALENLMESKTTLIVAHRLSTIKRSDCILVMDRGRVIAQGAHRALMTSCSYYRYLNELQGETIIDFEHDGIR